jgi:hypothetical protein
MSIPQLPGVPALSSYAPSLSTVLGIDGILSLFQSKPVWGLFKGGTLVAEPTTLAEIGMRGEARISDFPVERGSFASYNKVQQPDVHRILMIKSGTLAERMAFLAAIDQAKKSLDLYTILTPDVSYTDVNIETYEYRRTSSDGAGMLKVDLTIREVRQVTLQYTTTNNASDVKNPASATPVPTGKTQPKKPQDSALSAFSQKTQHGATASW